MKNSSKHQGRHFIVVGIALAVLYWIIEAAVHAFILHEGSFAPQLFAPDPHELWSRLLVAILVIPFGVYAYVVTIRRVQAEEALRESEEKYRALIETMDTAFVIIDGDGNVLDANSEYVRMTGHQTLDEILGRCVVEWTAEYDQERNAQAVRKCFQLGFTRNLEIDYVHKDGKTTPSEVNATVIETKDGPIVVTLCRDITARKQAEEELQAAYQRNETIISTSMDGFYTTHPDGNIFDCNAAFCEMVGYSREELLGMKITDLETVGSYEETAQHIQQAIEKGSDRFETAHCHKDGTIVDLEVSVTFVELPDERFFVCFARDITETKKLWQELNHQLVRDALTGVYNRRYFNETIIQEIGRADRYGHHVSFIMGDIDNLKAINDGYGHLVGDQILQGVAEVLQKSVRMADVIIRYGGDEFLVIMPETSTEQAHAALARFEEAFADWLDKQARAGVLHRDLPADLGFSMGVACYKPDTDVAVEEVLAQADAAMYRTKQAKRARRATA